MTPVLALDALTHEELCERVRVLEGEQVEILGELEEAYERLASTVLTCTQEADVLYGELRSKMATLERRVGDLTALASVGRSINSVLSLDPLIERIVEQVGHIAAADATALYLCGEHGDLVFHAGRGLSRGEGAEMVRQLSGEDIKRRVADHCPRFCEDLDRPGPLSVFRLKTAMRSAALLPLRAQGRSLGLLVLNSAAPDGLLADQETVLTTFGVQSSVAIANARLYRDLEKTLIGVLMSLATALEAKDRYTEGHSTRVAWYAVVLGKELGLGPEALENLHRAGLIHDIGKIGVGGSIIRKKGALTEEEWAKMRLHPLVGANIISSIELLSPALPGVRQHHEHWDGTGYPDGLQGEQIPIQARILAVADAFDALTSDRSYRPARAAEAALAEIMRVSGTQFDPRVVEALERCYADMGEITGERMTL